MSPPPTNIDGTEITGASIDGQDVQSITVDGQEVFSAFTTPVALSNLVAWYPFDPSSYSGMANRADDATDGLSGAANTTGFHGDLQGATYLPSGGNEDINAGPNSGAFDFDGVDDTFETFNELPASGFSDVTMMAWVFVDSTVKKLPVVTLGDKDDQISLKTQKDGGLQIIEKIDGFFSVARDSGPITSGTFFHVAGVYRESGLLAGYINGNLIAEGTSEFNNDFANISNPRFHIACADPNELLHDVRVDDARLYNTNLSTTQITQIYNRTDPN